MDRHVAALLAMTALGVDGFKGNGGFAWGEGKCLERRARPPQSDDDVARGFTAVIHCQTYLPSCFGGWARSHLRVASAFLESDLRTNIYVDGFNLYYGALRKTPHRWVNLESLFQLLLPKNTIQEIKYFTALVSARPNDPSQPQRQQLYLRALATLPKVSVHLGHFLVHEVTMPLVVAPGQPQQYARVIKTEEKGSDLQSSAGVAIYPQWLPMPLESWFETSRLCTKNPQPYATLRNNHQEPSTALACPP